MRVKHRFTPRVWSARAIHPIHLTSPHPIPPPTPPIAHNVVSFFDPSPDVLKLTPPPALVLQATAAAENKTLVLAPGVRMRMRMWNGRMDRSLLFILTLSVTI